MINGFFPQLQMLLFNGKLLIPTFILKIVILLILLFGMIIKFNDFKKNVFKRSFLIWWIFLVYLIADFIILLFSNEIKPVEIIFGYSSYYFYLLMIPFLYLFQGMISNSNLSKWFINISYVLVFFGIFQYLTNQPILPIESTNHAFQVNSVYYYGHVRAFSFFDSGLSFGHFLAFMCSLILVTWFYNRNKENGRIALIYLFILFFATYTTLTRNIYLEVGLTLITALFFLLSNRQKLFYQLLSVIYLCVGILVIIVAPFLSEYFSSSSLMKNESLLDRLNMWEQTIQQIIGNGYLNFFFGNGFIQSTKFPNIDAGLVDNSFLAVFLNTGLLGFILWVYLMWWINTRLIEGAINNPNSISISLAALYSTWMLTSFFNISFAIYPLLFMFGILIQKDPVNKT